MAKIIALTLVSGLLCLLVIVNGFYQKKQFYPAVVFITKSNSSIAVFYFEIFILFGITANLIKLIFFGELRRIELDRLSDRAWDTLTETCLAFAVFREDFNITFLALLILLVVLKAFHWLADERVEYIEQSPVISGRYHLRLISILTILVMVDLLFVYQAIKCTVKTGPTAQVIFGFEYAILLTFSFNSIIKYSFHINDMYESPCENKANFLLYSELIVRAFRVAIYAVFILIMLNLYVVPLFAFRPMVCTLSSFRKALNDVVLWQRAIRNMNTLYPDVSEQELSKNDNVCIICREEMLRACKKLPCNHIFHTACLRSWFQRQQSCPTCRLNILTVKQEQHNTNDTPTPLHVHIGQTESNQEEILNIIIENDDGYSLQEENKFHNSGDFQLKLRCTVPSLYSMQTVLQVSHLITRHYLKHHQQSKSTQTENTINPNNDTNSDSTQITLNLPSTN